MSQLLRNICSIIGAFEKYAQKDGDCSSLSKAELKQLIQREFADVIVNPNDPQTIESVLQLLDTDDDGKVDFEEFTVLVFRVARACYKKTQECQAPSECQSKKGEGSQQETRDEQTPGRDSSCRPTQEPQAPRDVSSCRPTVESQKPSQEQKWEPPESARQTSQTPNQEQNPTHQNPQKPSVTGPAQSKIQDCTQESQTTRVSSHQGTQKPKISDQGPTQEQQVPEQRTGQQPAQPHQGQGQEHICQGEVEPQRPGQQQQQPTGPQEEQRLSQRETQRSQRGQQEVASVNPGGSWVTEQSPSRGQVQQPQNPEQRKACRAEAEQKPQVGVPEQALSRQQQDTLTQREHLTQQQVYHPQGSNLSKFLPECQVPEQATSGHQECGGSSTSEQQLHQQERRPQNQGHSPTCHPEGQSHHQECRPQSQEQSPTCRPEGQSHQQDCRPQSQEQSPTCRPEDQSHQQEHRPQSQEQSPTCRPEGQSHQQECRPQSQEQSPMCRPEGQSRQQERRPQSQEQSPTCHPEGQSHQQERRPQSQEQSPTCRPEGQSPRQDRRPQNPVQAPTCHPEQEHQVPQQVPSGHQEGASLVEEQCRQRPRGPQKPEETQSYYSGCEPPSSEQGPSPQDQWVSQARESNLSCDPAEVTQDPKDSSTRKPLKATWPASHQKPLQFPSPWSPKQ